MTHRKIIFLIIGMCFLAYVNTLGHQFIGDDIVLFGPTNQFYKDPHNISRLISKDFITGFTDIDPASKEGSGSFSGCVTYRPVVSLSFFADYFLWRYKPFGYHLNNILIHTLNAILIFFAALFIVKNKEIAGLGAVLFAVHPINSEAVSNIGYRSDLLSLLFYLSALIAFIRYCGQQAAYRKRLPILSYLFFALALLAKESAALFPLVLLAYEYCFLSKGNFKKFFLRDKRCHFGFWVILASYLYLYFVVFPNTNTHAIDELGFKPSLQIIVASKILYEYLKVLFLPFTVTVLPPLYMPPAASIKIFELILACAFIVLALNLALRGPRGRREVSFLILWFFTAYLLVGLLIFSPNPFAFRFMYLPAVSFCMLAAILLQRAAVCVNQRLKSKWIGSVLLCAVIGLCLSFTTVNNVYFKDDFRASREMIRRYPWSAKPYWILGDVFRLHGRYKDASVNLQKYLELDKNNPFVTRMAQDYVVYEQLGRCYTDDLNRAAWYFKYAIRLRPDYVLAYVDLAKVYILKEDFPKALAYALQALKRNNRFIEGYLCAIHSYVQLKEFKEARRLLAGAFELYPDEPNLVYLREMITKQEKAARK